MTTHYLRDADNNTLVDVEATPDDISAVVLIKHFSRFLLANQAQAHDIATDFDQLQEIRGELFETDWTGTPDELAATRLKDVAARYGLGYVTD